MHRKELLSARASSYLREHLKSSSRSLTDLLPHNLWGDCCDPYFSVPFIVQLQLSSQRCGRFPYVTLCMAAVFAGFSVLV